ncbi:MAG: tetratricopeptide repeat-containing glycosyltransferase family protein [Verrucomicrobium sp.]|nr:tetratricopeptide repeat-containing glycosyltransferase family protein [Verrucomicrobium sp.]
MAHAILEKASRLYHQRRWDEAAALLQECRRRMPGELQVYNLLGLVALEKRDWPAAIGAFEAGLRLDPQNPELWNNFGLVMAHQRRWADSETCLRNALRFAPDLPIAKFSLVRALLHQLKFEEVLPLLDEVAPHYAEHAVPHLRGDYSFLRGTALLRLNRLEEAEPHFRRTLEIEPKLLEVLNNLGVTVRLLGRIDEAVELFDRALAIDPNHAESHINRATVRLLQGDYAEGWKEFDWRFVTYHLLYGHKELTMPRWEGQPLGEGSALLLLAEQGLGDTIQFIRLARQAKERLGGGRIIVETQAVLARLLRGVEGIDQVIIRGTPRPPFQAWSPLMSLARFFCPAPEAVPASVPYLGASLSGSPRTGPLRVGIVWAGSGDHAENRARSCPPEALLPLRDVPGVEIVSLQKLEPSAPPPPFPDAVGACRDFLDTARVVAGLDLVLAVDTAVGHLAGAMGKPLWLLLPRHAEWRWLIDRETTPWYPTARLMRQPARGDWVGLIARVARELEEAARTGAGLLPPASPS